MTVTYIVNQADRLWFSLFHDTVEMKKKKQNVCASDVMLFEPPGDFLSAVLLCGQQSSYACDILHLLLDVTLKSNLYVLSTCFTWLLLMYVSHCCFLPRVFTELVLIPHIFGDGTKSFWHMLIAELAKGDGTHQSILYCHSIVSLFLGLLQTYKAQFAPVLFNVDLSTASTGTNITGSVPHFTPPLVSDMAPPPVVQHKEGKRDGLVARSEKKRLFSRSASESVAMSSKRRLGHPASDSQNGHRTSRNPGASSASSSTQGSGSGEKSCYVCMIYVLCFIY